MRENQKQGHQVFIAGGTGYIGTRTVSALAERGHRVVALVRKGSRMNASGKYTTVTGDALDRSTYQAFVPSGATFIHLVGVAHPNPARKEEFTSVDLAAMRESLAAAREGGVSHFVYVSVAHPSPIMKAFVEVRMECEEMLIASGLRCTILRPWYVLGPGHRWPYLLVPLYWLARSIPSTHDTAVRLGLVKIGQMVGSLVRAVENPPEGVKIVDVPVIRQSALRRA